MNIQILIIDLGSQYTRVIGRTLREMGFRSVILPSARVDGWLREHAPKCIILSGGSASVSDAEAPQIPEIVFDSDVPILGICYGMQFIAKRFGGEVVSHHTGKEYGKTSVTFRDDQLFDGMEERAGIVWASHGDSVETLPPGFRVIAEAADSETIQAMTDDKRIWTLQFHPEVTHTKDGKTILRNFLANICGCETDWAAEDIIGEIRREVAGVTAGKRAIIGFSGGVDSTTLSAVLSSVLGESLLGVCIDTGGLRQGELAEIRKNAEAAGIRLRVIRAARRFGQAIGRTTDAETKRKRFKRMYGRILEEAAKRFGADFIVQGTLATDEIESGKAGQAELIKSHHNVGLDLALDELHPFRDLFKYEVRDLGPSLNLPKSVSERQPFPGPGLYVRVIGKLVTARRRAILRFADAEATRILRAHDLYDDISQLVVALICVPTVGIKGDGRAYKYAVVVRAVKTLDYMTVSGYQIPDSVRAEITETITKHEEIVRVWFDETNKPPATTELE